MSRTDFAGEACADDMVRSSLSAMAAPRPNVLDSADDADDCRTSGETHDCIE
jgi:hypothetical protein